MRHGARFFASALAAAALALAAPPAAAAGLEGGASGEPGPLALRFRALADTLDLDRDQRERVRAILGASGGEIRDAVGRVGEARRALLELVLEEAPGERLIRQAAGRLGEAVGDASLLTARIVAEIRPLLTPEQRERLGALRGRREARRGDARPGWNPGKRRL